RGGHDRLGPGRHQRRGRRALTPGCDGRGDAGDARAVVVGHRRGSGEGRRTMIPAAFDYVRAASADEAVKLLSSGGDDAKLIAGGHSLLPLMKLRLSTPSLLVDVDRISDLSYVREAGDQIEIGALSRMGDLANDPVLAQYNPFFAHVCGQVGDPQV